MGIFIILYATQAGRLVWNGAFLDTENTWRETFRAITAGTADTALAGAGRAVSATMGTKTVRACGRAHLRTRQLRVHQKQRGVMPAVGRRQTPAGQW